MGECGCSWGGTGEGEEGRGDDGGECGGCGGGWEWVDEGGEGGGCGVRGDECRGGVGGEGGEGEGGGGGGVGWGVGLGGVLVWWGWGGGWDGVMVGGLGLFFLGARSSVPGVEILLWPRRCRTGTGEQLVGRSLESASRFLVEM